MTKGWANLDEVIAEIMKRTGRTYDETCRAVAAGVVDGRLTPHKQLDDGAIVKFDDAEKLALAEEIENLGDDESECPLEGEDDD